MPKRFSTKDIERVLLSRGFSRVSQRGSHIKFTDGEHVVIVPAGRDVIRQGTFASIVRQAGLRTQDFEQA